MIAALLIQFGLLAMLYSYITRQYITNSRLLGKMQALYEWLAVVFLIEVVATAVYLAWKYLP